MEKEYRMSVFSKILYGLFVAAMLGFGIFLIADFQSFKDPVAGIVVSILLFAGAILLAMYIFKRQILLTENEITVRGAFGTKQIMFSEAKGFRVGDKAIFIYPLDDSRKKITINDYTAISKDDDLIEQLDIKLRNLDREDYQREEAVILQDAELGFTEDERAAKLSKWRTINTVYSLIAIGLLIAVFFDLINHIAFSWLLLVYPAAGILLMLLSNGLVRLYTNRISPYPSAFFGLFMSCIPLVIQQLEVGKILEFSKVWPLVGTAAAILAVLLSLIVVKQQQAFSKQIAFILIFAAAYGFGAVVQVNFILDDTQPKVYEASITDHYIKRGKSTTYHIVITAWGPQQEDDDITVPESFYDQVDVGSKVHLNLKPGKLNIPWYYVTK